MARNVGCSTGRHGDANSACRQDASVGGSQGRLNSEWLCWVVHRYPGTQRPLRQNRAFPAYPESSGRSGSAWPVSKRSAASSSVSELPPSHRTAGRLPRASRKACHAGSRSGYSLRSSSLNRRKAPLPWMARGSLRPARSPGSRVVSSCAGTRRWRRWNHRAW
jgi:hypothetical protein